MTSEHEYERLRRALGGERLPAAVVDLDALDANLARVLAPVRRSGKSLRIATKSVRCVELLRHVQLRGGDAVRGWMTYDAAETAFLAARGFDDLLLAYPTAQPPDAVLLASLAAQGKQLAVVVDDEAHLALLGAAAQAAGTVIEVVIEVDLALRLGAGRVHLGVLRSPLRTADQVLALARATRRHPGVRLAGLMGYEAQVAGVADRDPSAARGAAQRALKSVSRARIADLRASLDQALRQDGFTLRLVNGGGTGSVDWSAQQPTLSEVTAGSGLVTGHLFDRYDGLTLRPALFFALQVVRRPQPGVVTCAGGGYVASGAAGPSRLPQPWWPAGLSLIDLEGAGEVQTPLRVPESVPLSPGDPVFFRHAKAGELAERFDRYHLLRGERLTATVPTYRGEGGCFL